ncbi:MAG: hypothetical protein GY869_06215, partial [Planctomycetes bacterium]|nr:hypothetical protein [Planctomycetota bacterium]
TTANVDIQASVSGYLNAWIDYNGSGDWADAGEYIFADQYINSGSNSFSFTVPNGAISGTAPARFRFTSYNPNGNLSYTGLADDGEVEDYAAVIGALDFGDAPDPTYPTTLANDGARHVNDENTYLGSIIDVETDGLPTDDCLGDDYSTDDEDGITNFIGMYVTAFQANTANVDVTVSTAGYLNAWMDFNHDGDWDDSGEQIFSDLAVT